MASAQSDHSLCCLHESLATLCAHSEDSDQTGQIPGPLGVVLKNEVHFLHTDVALLVYSFYCYIYFKTWCLFVPSQYYLGHIEPISQTVAGQAYRPSKQLPRIHWNALPAFIRLLPTLAQFSYAVCQVVHLTSYVSDSVFIF